MPLIELTLPVPIDEAWRHLREPALIRRWFGWDYDGLDHEIDVIFMQEVVVGDHAIDFGEDRIELFEAGPDTLLRLYHEVSGDPDPIAEGWIQFAYQLRFALEHPGERRTVRTTGGGSADGDEYYRTEHQVGYVNGNELAVLTDDGTLTVSTYG